MPDNSKGIMDSLKEFKVSHIFNKEKIKHFIRFDHDLKKNPQKMAFSAAFGVFIGLLIPIGFQTIIIIPLSFILRINIFVSYLMTMVSNPFTALPLYYAMFKFGEFITGKEVSFTLIEKFIESPSWTNFSAIGGFTLANYMIGAVVSAVLGYIIVYYLVLFLMKKRYKTS